MPFMILEGLRDCHWCCFLLIMQNYQVEVYVISMEFLAENRRRLSRETPLGSRERREAAVFAG